MELQTRDEFELVASQDPTPPKNPSSDFSQEVPNRITKTSSLSDYIEKDYTLVVLILLLVLVELMILLILGLMFMIFVKIVLQVVIIVILIVYYLHERELYPGPVINLTQPRATPTTRPSTPTSNNTNSPEYDNFSEIEIFLYTCHN